MKIYEHSLKLGFDEDSAKAVEARMQSLIDKYHHRDLAQETFTAGYPKYVSRRFTDKKLHGFLKTVEIESFRPEYPWLREERFTWLSKKFNIPIKEVEGYVDQLSVLDALKIGEYWGILNSRVLRGIQRIEMPSAHFISTPTGGSPGYKRRFKRR